MIYTLRVKKGSGRGKILGFPTINFHIDPTVSVQPGIYRCFVSFEGKGPFLGALYFGSRTMFGEKEPSLEVHLLEGAETLPSSVLGKLCALDIREKIRDSQSFSSEEDLKVAMAEDLVKIQKLSENE